MVLATPRIVFSPEQRFLIEATKPGATASALPLDDLDMTQLVSLAAQNRVIPLLANYVSRREPGRHPELTRYAEQIKRKSLLQHGEAVRILRACASEGIRVAPLKGSFLSRQIYGDVATRHSGDIDLMVRPADFSRMLHLMQTHDYRPHQPARLPEAAQLLEFLAPKSRMHIIMKNHTRATRVELHWRIGRLDVFPDAAIRYETCFADGVPFEALQSPYLLLYLAYHGTRHGWARLAWLTDFAMLAAQSPDDVDRAHALAENVGLNVIWRATTALADRVYGTRLASNDEPYFRRRVEYLLDHTRMFDAGSPPNPLIHQWNMRDTPVSSARHMIDLLTQPYDVGVEWELKSKPVPQIARRVFAYVRRRFVDQRK